MSKDNQLRTMLRGYLEHVGYVVIPCTSGQSMLALCSSERDFDLLIADLQAPDNSIHLLEEFAETRSHASILVISELVQEKQLRQTVESHGWRLLCKPLLLLNVLRSIQDAIDPQLFNTPLRAIRKSKRRTLSHPLVAMQAAGLSHSSDS